MVSAKMASSVIMASLMLIANILSFYTRFEDAPNSEKIFHIDLNLNLNSLLVKRQIDNPSPGAVTGGKEQ